MFQKSIHHVYYLSLTKTNNHAKINNNMTPQTKWHGLAPDINKTANQAQENLQNTERTRLETNTMTQSPWLQVLPRENST